MAPCTKDAANDARAANKSAPPSCASPVPPLLPKCVLLPRCSLASPSRSACKLRSRDEHSFLTPALQVHPARHGAAAGGAAVWPARDRRVWVGIVSLAAHIAVMAQSPFACPQCSHRHLHACSVPPRRRRRHAPGCVLAAQQAASLCAGHALSLGTPALVNPQPPAPRRQDPGCPRRGQLQ